MRTIYESPAQTLKIPSCKIRRKIHTDLKILVSLNTLPVEYKRKIHRSQFLRYKNTNPAEYISSDLSPLITKEIDFV